MKTQAYHSLMHYLKIYFLKPSFPDPYSPWAKQHYYPLIHTHTHTHTLLGDLNERLVCSLPAQCRSRETGSPSCNPTNFSRGGMFRKDSVGRLVHWDLNCSTAGQEYNRLGSGSDPRLTRICARRGPGPTCSLPGLHTLSRQDVTASLCVWF